MVRVLVCFWNWWASIFTLSTVSLGGLSWSLFSSKQHESCAWATNALTRYSPSMWKFIRKAISVHKSLGVNSFWRIILVVFILFVIKKLLFSCSKNIKWVRCFRNLRKKVDTTFVSNLFLLLHWGRALQLVSCVCFGGTLFEAISSWINSYANSSPHVVYAAIVRHMSGHLSCRIQCVFLYCPTVLTLATEMHRMCIKNDSGIQLRHFFFFLMNSRCFEIVIWVTFQTTCGTSLNETVVMSKSLETKVRNENRKQKISNLE